MNPNLKCDICGRRARHHQTSIDGQDVVVQDLCGLHARNSAMAEFKDVLDTQVDKFPEVWMSSEGERRQQIVDAGNLRELCELFRLEEIAKSFPPPPQ